jgi:hypothetical protein
MTLMATSTSSPSASGAEGSSSSRLRSSSHVTLPSFPRSAAVLALLGTVASAAAPAHAADPAIGDCLLAAEASLKLRAEHKLRVTRTQLLVCSSPSCPAEVRQECMKRIDEVNAAAPTIVLAVKNGAGKELSAVKVTVDGQVLADHLDGSALSVDPGAHEFTFEAGGMPPLTETIILHEGEKDRRETVLLGGAPPAVAAVQAPGPSSDSEAPHDGSHEGTGNTQRAIGLVTGGLGIAGLAVGSVFGVLASSAWKTAKNECPSYASCSSQAISDRSSSVTDATVSTVGFIAGGVLAATGVVLYVTAPKSGSARVGLEAHPGGFAITGGF